MAADPNLRAPMSSAMKIGIATKQRIREAMWKTYMDKQTNPKIKCDEVLSRKLQPYYRDNYINRSPTGFPMYIYLRNKAVIEVVERSDKDNIKHYMKSMKAPGAQVSFPDGDKPTIKWFCK